MPLLPRLMLAGGLQESLYQYIRRNIVHEFNNLNLNGDSSIDDLPFIGKELKQNMALHIKNDARSALTIKEVLDWILQAATRTPPAYTQDQRLSLIRLSMQILVENPRANDCTSKKYHIRDISKAGFYSLCALINVVGQRDVQTPNLNFAIIAPTNVQSRNLIRSVREWQLRVALRNKESAICSCQKNRADCLANGCLWNAPQRGCTPTHGSPSFEGVDSYSGQKRNDADPPVRNRGSYVTEPGSPNQHWRKPRPLLGILRPF